MGLDTAPAKRLGKQGHNNVLVDCFMKGLDGVVPAGSRNATVNKCLRLASKLHAALEVNLEAILIALGVAGAFDKVWWAALLANLEHCGVAGKCVRLMKSYLCARFPCAVANGIASETLEFLFGVPQGAT